MEDSEPQVIEVDTQPIKTPKKQGFTKESCKKAAITKQKNREQKKLEEEKRKLAEHDTEDIEWVHEKLREFVINEISTYHNEKFKPKLQKLKQKMQKPKQSQITQPPQPEPPQYKFNPTGPPAAFYPLAAPKSFSKFK